MMKRSSFRKLLVVAAVALIAAPLLAQGATGNGQLEQKVRHELLMLPYYGVFDNLAFRVEGNTVVLLGQVRRPTLRPTAERVVKQIEGVSAVDNRIEVLPLSFHDDRVRLGVLRAVYGNSALYRYNLGAIAPIRIVVKNGNVTLEGVVANEMDRNIAFLAANGVPGVFSVKNNLHVNNG
ncbi:MAG TPA: BON domain-containing protein [Bryobacteraceae bacterium]|nr:BON domain-containing protein [Bryobacteraceae bacterium]